MPDGAYGKMRQENNRGFCQLRKGIDVDGLILKNTSKGVERGGMYEMK